MSLFIKKSNPTFRLMEKGALSGIANLNPLLTINSVTVAPDFVYKGGDAGAINWTAHNYGETLTLQAGTSPTFNQGSPLLGSNDDSVKFNNGGYYRASNSSFGDIATEDFVVEMVIKHAPENSYVLNKSALGGWRMRNAAAQLYMNLLGSSNILSSTVTSSWCHVMVFFDRSGSAIFYTNGAPGGAVDISAFAGSASNGGLLEISSSSGAFPGGNNIAYMAMWKRDAWLDTHLQASVATERFYRLTGFYPQVAKGTALPTTATRATVAYLDKCATTAPAELLIDGDMEAEGTEAWTAGSAAILTKEVSFPNSTGSQALRVTYNGSNHPYSYQIKLVKGRKYRARGQARGSGTAAFPLIKFGASAFGAWIGSTSTTWQNFDVTGIATDTVFVMHAWTTTSDYCEFDNISVTEIPTRELYLVGPGWLRTGSRSDTNGNFITGALIEQASQNKCLQSQTFDSATWFKGQLTIADGYEAPDGTLTADALEEDGSAAQIHYLRQTNTGAGSTVYVWSAWLKAGNRDWGLLQFFSTTDGASSCYFNLATGAVGTSVNLDAAGMEYWGDGWYRCWIKDTRATAEALFVYIYVAEANGDTTFDGLYQTSIYAWGAQLEVGDYPTSYVPTTTAAVTRNADVLVYKGDDGNLGGVGSELQGAISCRILVSDRDASLYNTIITLSDGGSSNDYMALSVHISGSDRIALGGTSTEAGGAFVNLLGANVDTTTDGKIHGLKALWGTSSAKVYKDELLDSSGAAGSAPNDLDRINVGSDIFGAAQLNGLIENIKIYMRPTRR